MASAAEPNIHWHSATVSRADRQRLLGQRGVILWFTGLSGSGKSTIATLLEQKLVGQGRAAYRLDGDNVRHGLNKGLGFSTDDRRENIRRVGEVAKLVADAGLITLVSLISPYRLDRDEIRNAVPAGDFIEIYVKASLATAEARDPKGLYKKARAGEIKGFTGIDDPYEPPDSPEIVLDTETDSPARAVEVSVEYLRKRGYLSG
ncbi:MAG: adenylyl-sulfate kinase, partial [Chthoniobacterales bacterium]|nr:adenylyl-sulfate kinase [Chthoniobacterales bacterium]